MTLPARSSSDTMEISGVNSRGVAVEVQRAEEVQLRTWGSWTRGWSPRGSLVDNLLWLTNSSYLPIVKAESRFTVTKLLSCFYLFIFSDCKHGRGSNILEGCPSTTVSLRNVLQSIGLGQNTTRRQEQVQQAYRRCIQTSYRAVRRHLSFPILTHPVSMDSWKMPNTHMVGVNHSREAVTILPVNGGTISAHP